MLPVQRGRSSRREKRPGILLASFAVNLFLVVALGWASLRAAHNHRMLEQEMNERIDQTNSHLTNLTTSLHSMSASLNVAKAQLAEKAKALTISGSASAADKRWLTIGMTTVPRRYGADYLSRTLQTLLEELPLDKTDPLHGQVHVLVMNNRPGNHTVFYKVKERIAASPDPLASGTPEGRFAAKARLYVSMVDNPGTVPDPAPHMKDPDDFNNPTNRPGREVRRQTCDLVSMLQQAASASHYFMFMEDDFRVCPNALHIVHYALRKLNAQPSMSKWLGLRISYGMNGILLRDEHLAHLSGYLRKHTARLPADLLWMEWIQGRRRELWNVTKHRPLAVFRSNLLDHIGAQSSFAVRTNRLPWPGCFDPMATVWSLHKSERFQLKKCPHSDLSPCPNLGPDDDPWLKHPISWPHILDGADTDHPETLAETAANVTALQSGDP